MEIQLNLASGSRQRDFLDYLNSALRARMPNRSGTAGGLADGSFFSQITGAFSVDQSHVELTWRLQKAADGTLASLSVQATDSSVSSQSWQTAAREFVMSVLTATVAAKRERFFRRSLFYYIGPQLDGEYWLQGYRFAPVFPGDPKPHLINAERVVSIDQDIEALDDMHAHALAEESSRRHAARLSLLLNVGLYRQEQSMRWVLPISGDQSESKSVCRHLGFSHPDAVLTAMPEKGKACSLGAYTGSLATPYRVAGKLHSLPREARKILHGVDQADPLVTVAFDRAARLYQVAVVCGHLFPSVGLAYRVAAVEAMSTADKTCNGFSEFMRRYITSRTDFDDILDYLYGNVRSGHFHGGEFPMGEFSRPGYFDALMDMDTMERDSVHRACYELTREAIVNWMQSVVPE